MKYTSDQIGSLMQSLKPKQPGANILNNCVVTGSALPGVCIRQTGEDMFTLGCEDAD